MIRVTIWNEFRQEKTDAPVKAVYPEGIHRALAGHLSEAGFEVGTATLDEPEHGLTKGRLADTQVLIWWGHRAHHEVDDAMAERVAERVRDGMGLIVLHSAHFSKPFEHLMGTTCRLGAWDASGTSERIWTVDPMHPIAEGVDQGVTLPRVEMYSEPFDVPPPDELVFISSFGTGEVFRSGCIWQRGRGRVFYFRPGHETIPLYHDARILRILTNAVNLLGGDA